MWIGLATIATRGTPSGPVAPAATITNLSLSIPGIPETSVDSSCPGAGCRSPIGLARASCSEAASTWSPETTWSMASPYPGPS